MRGDTVEERPTTEGHAPLLELATPQLYRRNLFRVLGLPVTATTADVRRQQKRLELQRKLGVAQGDAQAAALSLAPPPTEEAYRAALERLTDPEARLLDELFWFWPLDGATGPDAALRALEQGRLEEARRCWEEEAASARDPRAVARHNLAVLDHLQALDREVAPVGPAGADGVQLWTQALAGWRAVAETEGFWSRLGDRIRELDDARLTTGVARRIRSTLPRALLSINAALAFQAGERKDPAAVKKHLELLRAADRDGLAAEVLRAGLEPTRRQIKAMVEDARSRWVAIPHQGDRIVRELHDQAAALLATVDAVLEPGDTTRGGLHDLVSEAMSDGAWAFAKKTDAWAEGARLVELARAVAASPTQRAKQDDEIARLRKSADDGNDWCAPGYWELPAETRDQLEAIRPKAQGGDYDGALAALGALDPALGRPLRRAAAFCLSLKGINLFNRASAEYVLDPPIARELLAKVRAMGPAASVLLRMRPSSSTPSYMNPPCLGCGRTGYSQWYNFDLKGVPVFWCVTCNLTHGQQIEQQKAAFRPHITTALEHLLLAAAIDPDDPGIQRNLTVIRERAASFQVPIPKRQALEALRRAKLPAFPAIAEVPAPAPGTPRAGTPAPGAAPRKSHGTRQAVVLTLLLAAVIFGGWFYLERIEEWIGGWIGAFEVVQVIQHFPAVELHAVHGASARDLWVVGPSGLAVHWGGTSWSAHSTPTSQALYGVWTGPDGGAWAVGAAGTVLRWADGTWGAASAETSADLFAVWGSAADDVWAVGAGGTAVHWDGEAWTRLPAGPTAELHGLWGSGPDDVWAVGEHGIAVHWDGTSWTQHLTGAMRQLNQVWGSGRADVWAVGRDGAIAHWDGATWAQVPSGTAEWLYALWGTALDDVWAAGDRGKLLHWDGAGWRSVQSGVGGTIRAAWGGGAGDVWAVGGQGALRKKGATVRPSSTPAAHGHPAGAQVTAAATPGQDEAAWPVVGGASGVDLDGIWLSGPKDGWAVGKAGTVRRWNGTEWSAQQSAATVRLHAVSGSGARQAWAVGEEGTILRWNGAAWRSVPSGTKAGLRGVWTGGPGEAWAVGEAGARLHWNGATWSVARGPPKLDQPLGAVWGSGPEDVWAVGKGGTILHWNGATWAKVPSGVEQDLLAVWGRGPKDAWAVGAGGISLHWDGKAWLEVPSGSTEPLRGIWGGAKEVWAVGYDAILHWDGRGWERVPTLTRCDLGAVAGDGAGGLWAVGKMGCIRRGAYQAPAAVKERGTR
jgi:hypothetical protein